MIKLLAILIGLMFCAVPGIVLAIIFGFITGDWTTAVIIGGLMFCFGLDVLFHGRM